MIVRIGIENADEMINKHHRDELPVRRASPWTG